MSVVLGINAFHAGAAAVLVIDGQPVFGVAEERLNRVKYYAGFPKLAIQACLAVGGLRFADIDHVAVGRDSSANRAKKAEFLLRNPSRILNLLKIRASRSQLGDMKALFASECGAEPEDLRFSQHNVEHHLAHTASAYFASAWDEAAGLTIDGSGDFVTCMFSRCRGDEIEPLHRIHVPHSLGSLYTMICEFIGYPRYGDEGKVMGLAPLGEDEFRDVFDTMIEPTDTGFVLNGEFFVPFGADQGMSVGADGIVAVRRHYSQTMVDRFGAPRDRSEPITRRDENLAFGVQRVFEDTAIHLMNLLHAKVPTTRLAMAGGCALNSVTNGKLLRRTPFQTTCIQPAAGDDGLALGAALYLSNVTLREGKRWVMRDAYLGPEFSESQIRTALDDAGLAYERYDRADLVARVADEIVDGKVLGWFQGRMEWGPRALGNRSILVHPGLPTMKDTLNARIKRREAFRPFAPAVLAERQAEIFDHDHPSPFMLHVYEIKPAWRERLCAVTHVDGTGRLQSVARDENPLYYDLIEEFGRRTGIPVLLNTSFNENEPIVCTPAEAIDCYQRTKMDVLAIGPFVCRKPPQD